MTRALPLLLLLLSAGCSPVENQLLQRSIAREQALRNMATAVETKLLETPGDPKLIQAKESLATQLQEELDRQDVLLNSAKKKAAETKAFWLQIASGVIAGITILGKVLA